MKLPALDAKDVISDLYLTKLGIKYTEKEEEMQS